MARVLPTLAAVLLPGGRTFWYAGLGKRLLKPPPASIQPTSRAPGWSGHWPDGADGPDGDGWFGTGDIAVADDAGELRLVGRSSELVIVNGFNVYPAEVEAVLAAEHGVAEVAVVGVPDPRTGEAVRAFVVPTAGTRLDPDDLLRAAAGSLARFKLPTAIEVVAALPRTVTGKIMKWQLARGGSDAAE